MNRPVIIVNPLSSGVELAPAFKARGIPSIAITLNYKEWPEFGSKIHASDFIEVILDQPGIEDVVRKYDPIAIIAGTEEGIPLAERLTASLTPQFLNDPKKSIHRSHKALMQEALKEAGVPTLKTLHSATQNEVEDWIKKSGLENSPLIVKPPVSTGSEKVFHIAARAEWRNAFQRILKENVISGKINESVVIQEQAIGTEFAVGTVSANGRHYLTHLMKYNKISAGERQTVFDHVEFVPYNFELHGELFEYVERALDALGIRWGAAHTEVIVTQKGPRLIESSPRLIGGPVMEFTREATGTSQVDKLVELYALGDVVTKDYALKKTVVPVFLKAAKQGTVFNLEVFDEISKLPTFFSCHIWISNGDSVQQTVDFLTAIGIVGLAGDRASIFRDYEKIRAMESQLKFH